VYANGAQKSDVFCEVHHCLLCSDIALLIMGTFCCLVGLRIVKEGIWTKHELCRDTVNISSINAWPRPPQAPFYSERIDLDGIAVYGPKSDAQKPWFETTPHQDTPAICAFFYDAKLPERLVSLMSVYKPQLTTDQTQRHREGQLIKTGWSF